jgi:putative adhesin
VQVVIGLEISRGHRNLKLVTKGPFASRNAAILVEARAQVGFSGLLVAGYGASRTFKSRDDLSLVKAPRNARLIVNHNSGDVHVDELAGTIHVTARHGEITLRLAGEGPRSIDAKSQFGGVISDFPGKGTRRRWLVGHQFVQGSSPDSQDLYLRIGYGDIIIVKASKPQAPPPVT